jgi:hypothetical protein
MQGDREQYGKVHRQGPAGPPGVPEDSGPAGRDPAPDAAGPVAASSGRTIDRGILESILQRALVAPDLDDAALTSQVEALAEVARRHRGEPLSMEPVGAELVEAALRAQYGVTGPHPLWRSMSLEIARMLLEDPVSSGRLRRLWDRLLESS